MRNFISVYEDIYGVFSVVKSVIEEINFYLIAAVRGLRYARADFQERSLFID